MSTEKYEFDRKKSLARYLEKRKRRMTGKIRILITPRSKAAQTRSRSNRGRFNKSNTHFLPISLIDDIDDLINFFSM
jgi:hypothetical protein